MCDSVNIFHLTKLTHSETVDKLHLNRSYIEEIPFKDKKRIACRLTDYQTDQNVGFYYKTNNIKKLLENVDTNPIFLHIDLDFFVNAFDGGNFSNVFNFSLQNCIEEEIPLIFNELSFLKNQIIDCSIATSPGFCPSQYWKALLNRLEEVYFNR
jgi:hypothetical protein